MAKKEMTPEEKARDKAATKIAKQWMKAAKTLKSGKFTPSKKATKRGTPTKKATKSRPVKSAEQKAKEKERKRAKKANEDRKQLKAKNKARAAQGRIASATKTYKSLPGKAANTNAAKLKRGTVVYEGRRRYGWVDSQGKFHQRKYKRKRAGETTRGHT